MFRKNSRHLQIPLTSHVDELPEPLRKRLRNSWTETFYQQFFCRLDETPFEVLYADMPSRPNVPVNVLVALEFLKAANAQLTELQAEFEAEMAALQAKSDPLTEPLETFSLKPKKTDIQVQLVTLAWLPFWQDDKGALTAAW